MQRCRMCGAEVVTAREHPLCAHCYRNSEFDHRAWLWIVLAIGIFIIAAVRGCAGVVTEEFLDQIAWVESRNNPAAVGRHGEHTAFQLKQCFVDDTCRFFGWRRLLITSLTPEQARAVARAGCLMLEHRLTRVGRPNPNQAQIYRSYRLGLAGCQRQSAASQGTFPPGSPRTTSPRAGRGAGFTASVAERFKASGGESPSEPSQTQRGPRVRIPPVARITTNTIYNAEVLSTLPGETQEQAWARIKAQYWQNFPTPAWTLKTATDGRVGR